MTREQAKKTFAELMAKARTSKLSEADKKQLTIARQTLRRQRHPAMWNPKKPMLVEGLPNPDDVPPVLKRYHPLIEEAIERRTERVRRARADRAVKKRAAKAEARAKRAKKGETRAGRENPGPSAIGKVIEIRYKRTVGKYAGELYKHVFKTRPTLYLMPDKTIRIK